MTNEAIIKQLGYLLERLRAHGAVTLCDQSLPLLCAAIAALREVESLKRQIQMVLDTNDVWECEVEQSRAAVEAWKAVQSVITNDQIVLFSNADNCKTRCVFLDQLLRNVSPESFGPTPQAAILAAKGE